MQLTERIFSFISPQGSDSPSLPVEAKALTKTTLLADAEQALYRGEVEVALDKLIPILNSNPDDQRANAMVGAILLSLGQVDRAEELLHAAVTLSDFSDGHSVVNLASTLRRRGEHGIALRCLFKAIKTVEDNKADDAVVARLSEGVAQTYFSIQNFTEAADWYLNAALRKPNDVQYWVMASTMQFPAEAVNITFAQGVLLKAMELNPNNSLLTYSLGLSVLESGRTREAAVLFDEAVRLDPSNIDAVIAGATAYHMLGEAAPAVAFYSKALEARPDNADLAANFARLLNSLGHRENALQFLQRAQQLSSSSPAVLEAIQALTAVSLRL